VDWILSHPVTVLLLGGAATLGLTWLGLHREQPRLLLAACVIACLSGILGLAAWWIDTPAELGERAVMSLIDRAVAGDPAGASAWIAPEAVIHFGGFDRPALDRREIDRDLQSLCNRHRVESHVNSSLRAVTVGPDQALVEVACLTRTASSPGHVATTWSFRVRRDPDGVWRVHALSFDRLFGSEPRPGIF